MIFRVGDSNRIEQIKFERIVSLVPSLTEFIYDQAPEKLVGVTKFCVHPLGLKSELVVVGGTKSLKIDKIKALKPDLIIANKEENVKEQVEELKDFPVLLTDINNRTDAFEGLREISKLIGSDYLWDESFYKKSFPKSHKSVLYVIWNDPIMSIGNDTFIHDILSFLGLENAMINFTRYPVVSKEMIEKLNPDYVFLSSEPFPFKEKHINRFKEIFPESEVLLVDGEAFSWYGSRMFKVSSYLEGLLKDL